MVHDAGFLAHHFDSLEQQHEAATLGMWLFLATEILFFGGMFTAYGVYRTSYPQAFVAASHHLNVAIGTFNTAVLLTSSLTVALAVHAAEHGRSRTVIGLVIATMLLGGTFLGVKAFEYHHKFVEHLIPGHGFSFAGPHSPHAQLFFSLYFVMTGFHALHILIGLAVMAFVIRLTAQGRVTPEHHPAVELTGLYWHFVDIIWVFLFPLLYLIR
ncbi:MAG: cytochrome c oxidase subunit 3 family protein [Candidatus Wallbacteria bacterium]|nr:cytochrome c oxidase subunit 3 family protein [Candidatus Wallbacteria bacterium]